MQWSKLYEILHDITFHRLVSIATMNNVLPQQHETQYNLRARPHDKLLIPKTADLNDRDFIVRML